MRRHIPSGAIPEQPSSQDVVEPESCRKVSGMIRKGDQAQSTRPVLLGTSLKAAARPGKTDGNVPTSPPSIGQPPVRMAGVGTVAEGGLGPAQKVSSIRSSTARISAGGGDGAPLSSDTPTSMKKQSVCRE